MNLDVFMTINNLVFASSFYSTCQGLKTLLSDTLAGVLTLLPTDWKERAGTRDLVFSRELLSLNSLTPTGFYGGGSWDYCTRCFPSRHLLEDCLFHISPRLGTAMRNLKLCIEARRRGFVSWQLRVGWISTVKIFPKLPGCCKVLGLRNISSSFFVSHFGIHGS